MAREKSDNADGGDDMGGKPSAAPHEPLSDPVDPPAFAPDPSEAERRALDTFASEPTPDEFSGRQSAGPETEFGSEPVATTRDDGDQEPYTSDPSERGMPASAFERDEVAGPLDRDEVAGPLDRDEVAGPPERNVFARPPEPAARPEAAAAQSEPAAYIPAAAAPAAKRGSFAGRALTFLIVLIAGVALGIWGAPKLAPMLPAGMAPVAAWLTPTQTLTETRLATVEASLGDVAAQVAAAPTLAAIEAQTQGTVGTVRTDLESQIAAIRKTLDQSDFTDANERIGRLETTLAGATSELASLRSQIAAGATEGLSKAAVASIDTYRAELDGLRAEVTGLAGSVSGLGARLDEATANAEARASAAEQQATEVQAAAAVERDLAAAQADVAAIRAALADGAPFAEPLGRLAANAGVSPPAGLEAAAASGVATPAVLRAEFSDEAHEAIRASIVAGAGDGLLSRSRAFLESHVASRALSPQQGASPDAVLSRIEDALRRDDLSAALTEAGQLPSEAAAAMSGWIAAAQLRADAEAGLAEMSAAVSTMN